MRGSESRTTTFSRSVPDAPRTSAYLRLRSSWIEIVYVLDSVVMR